MVNKRFRLITFNRLNYHKTTKSFIVSDLRAAIVFLANATIKSFYCIFTACTEYLTAQILIQAIVCCTGKEVKRGKERNKIYRIVTIIKQSKHNEY